MKKRIRIRHHTTYTYADPVELGPHRLMIRPRSGYDVQIERSRLELSPPARIQWQRDIYGNSVATATFSTPTRSLAVRSEVVLHHAEEEPLNFVVDEKAIMWPFQFDPMERTDLVPYQTLCFPSDGPVVRDWLAQFWRPGQVIETYALINNINQAIVRNFAYQMREQPGVQRPAETLAKGSGSCRDFATLFIDACRYLGIPARFVSGYLHCPSTVQGHGSTHAWAEAYLPGAGWKGFDNTSGIVVGQDHIATAVCRHPADAPPISGSFTGPVGSLQSMQVEVEVQEVESVPGMES